MWLWPFGPTLKLPDRWVTDMTSLLVPLSFALTTLTPFRAHPSDGPKLILKAPASSWECGSETTLWSKETLTKGGVWFPPLSSKWIHTVGACVREFVRVCVCVLVSSWSHATHLVVTHSSPSSHMTPTYTTSTAISARTEYFNQTTCRRRKRQSDHSCAVLFPYPRWPEIHVSLLAGSNY